MREGLDCLMESKTPDATGMTTRASWSVALFLFACAFVSGALSALTMLRRFDTIGALRNPWSIAASIAIPTMLAFLAFSFVSTGRKRRVLSVMVMVLAATGMACGLLVLVT